MRTQVENSSVQTLAIKDLVYELRSRLGLTQVQCAARLGVAFSTLNRWENGRAQPSPLAMKLIRDEVERLGDRGQDLRQSYFPETALHDAPHFAKPSWHHDFTD